MIGELINTNLEVSSSDNEICGVGQLLHGAEALVILFVPFCYGEMSDHSMETAVLEVNRRIDEFNQQDLRVICITREPPSTVRHWVSDRNLQLEVFSDGSLEFSNSIVGSFDLSLYIQATKGVQLGSYFVCMPAVAIIGGDGKIISKYIASSPETVQVGPEDILQMLGIN